MKKKPKFKLELFEEEYVPENEYIEEISPTTEEKTQKELLIRDQANLIREFLLVTRSPEEINAFLGREKYKSEAIGAVLQEVTPSPLKDVLELAYLKRKIGGVKNRPLTVISTKNEGSTLGQFVRKTPSADGVQRLKHKVTWLKKNQDEGQKNIGEEVCEYIGNNLMNHLLGDNSPKVRLHKDPESGKVSIMSRFIPNFSTFSKLGSRDVDAAFMNAEGKTKFFFSNAVLCDYDTNLGNIGTRVDDEGVSHLVRIDNGKALSYNTARHRPDTVDTALDGHREEPVVNIVRDRVFRNQCFKKGGFEGPEFAQELYAICENTDLNTLRNIIRLSLDNIEEAYGPGVLESEAVRHELGLRMNFPAGNVSRQTLEDAIIANVSELRDGLKTLAVSELGQMQAIAQGMRKMSTSPVVSDKRHFGKDITNSSAERRSKERSSDSRTRKSKENVKPSNSSSTERRSGDKKAATVTIFRESGFHH
jgi:hypothetical protein